MKYKIKQQQGGAIEIEADSYAFDAVNKEFLTFWRKGTGTTGQKDAVLTLRSHDVAQVEVKAEEG